MKLIVGPVGSGKTTKVIELAKESAWDRDGLTRILTDEYDLLYVESVLDRLYPSTIGITNLFLTELGNFSYDSSMASIVSYIITGGYKRVLVDFTVLGEPQLNLIYAAEQYARLRGNNTEVYVTMQTNSDTGDEVKVVDWVGIGGPTKLYRGLWAL